MAHVTRTMFMLILLISIGGVGCSESPRSKLDRGVSHAEKSFNSLHTNLLSKLAFQDVITQGGSLVTVVLANAPEKADLPRFVMDKASTPWSVVLRQDEESLEIVIEGYGEDLATPLVTRRVALPEFDDQ